MREFAMELSLNTISCVVAWLLAWLMWRQYRTRLGLHQLVWTIGLALFAFAITLQTTALAQGRWTDLAYRLWYFCGAMHGVTFLGQGTLHFLDRRQWTRRFLEALTVLVLISLAVVLNAPLDFSRLATPASASGRAFAEISQAGFATPRAWTIPFNIYGTLWLVGGAALSGLRVFRSSKMRALATAFIAVGGLVLASAESLTRFNILGLVPIGFCMGLLLLFAGFVLSSLENSQLGWLEQRMPWRGVMFALFVLTGLVLLAQTSVGWVIKDYPGLLLIACMFFALLWLVIGKIRLRMREMELRRL